MGSNSSSIFKGKRDQDVGAAINGGDGLRRDLVLIELSVLGMFSRVARDYRYSM